MSTNHEPSKLSKDIPFLSNSDAISYVSSSKLMVLVSNSNLHILQRVCTVYGNNASCVSEDDEIKRYELALKACQKDQHVVAINVGDIQDPVSPKLQPFSKLAYDYNYIVSFVDETQSILPDYIGWHLNEADSCMLGLCAKALLDDLLRNNSEFCSDFRNFSQSETIPEMLEYYQLAPSNHNGMLHCTAKYFGANPPPSSEKYFTVVKENITMAFETTVIGLVFTPRTFGARLKLSSEQLKLWGGDDTTNSFREIKPSSIKENGSNQSLQQDSMSSLSSAMAEKLVLNDSERSIVPPCPSTTKEKSPRYFPNCQASLVYPTENASDDPDFHPVSGEGRKAHMTLGIAPGESAVTTGYDLLEIVELEKQVKDWKTYEVSRGWLRDYGENRWVLYMKNKITVNSLFAGVYNFS
ncbi:2',3'-cyclic-nucleotide 3'-phosphodiesterase [Frankliniella fusca]|uniref:2',3'-cyclic-nucleotide 3'-phosphodiesterase n=1 Tax=Frankliniella fusca TaxID=407009 RepID=A0AAE1H3F7_9NEOP|nr:2',3'-cyclic-nucleotide 3'-phosphodiesterase [Frankliniella fusca]